MNLSYEIQEPELRTLFEKFGEVELVEIPLRRGGQATGYAFINYKETEGAVAAFAQLDKTYFQGRKIHILPAQQKPKRDLPEPKREEKASERKDEEDKKPAKKNWMDLNKEEGDEEANSSEDEAIRIEHENKDRKSTFK